MSDEGSATVVAIAVLAATVVVGAAIAGVAGIATDRATARSAADLAALAGAYEVRRELGGATGEPCDAARRTALANRATVTWCRVYGDGSVELEVASGGAQASARAGPEREGPGGDSG